MKKVFLIAIILTSSSLTSCRNKPNEIGLSCQRLSSCYSAYGSMIKNPQIKTLVENAQKSGDESTCLSGIAAITQETSQQCPF